LIENKKILVTGATGQVAGPIAADLAARNEVWCASRFSDPVAKKALESKGIKTFKWTMGSDDFRGLPDDFNYVVHAACDILEIASDYEAAIRINAEGTGLLMAHCRKAEAFLYVSSLCVYKTPPDPAHLCDELTWPLGSHPVYAPSYSTGKISTEAVVRSVARIYGIPTIIARLGMAFGTSGHGGVPTMVFKRMAAGEEIHVPSRPFYYSMIHEDDFVANIEPFLRAATVPATIVNWVGDEIAGEREMYDYIARISGFTPKYVTDDMGGYEGGGLGDPKRRQAITGPNKRGWKAAILKTLRDNFPEHKFAD
jgi:UDP-glucuronate 4-epimerase